MNYLFLSYTNKSLACADNLHAVLTALGAKLFNYRHPNEDTLIDLETVARLKSECAAASFLVQILDGRLGTLRHEGEPILKLEFDWFMEARAKGGDRNPPPIIVSLSKAEDTPTENYITYATKQGSQVVLCSGIPNALQVVTGWYRKHSLFVPSAKIIGGHMDLEVAEPPADRAIAASLYENRLIPQKLLYTSPLGALFWRTLSGERNSSIRKVYDVVDFGSNDIATMSRCIRLISQWDSRVPLSIIALGPGDGRREVKFVKSLLARVPNAKRRVLLVDVSKTLIATAATAFGRLSGETDSDFEVNFALADFEHPTTLSYLMKQWSPDLPVVILFFGNTLGNIDFTSFMAAVSSAMKTGDMLLAEVSMAQANGPTRGPWTHVSAYHKDRFNFLGGPIRQLGVNPQNEHFKTQIEEDEDLYVRRVYAYQLDPKELETVRSIVHVEVPQERKLRILRVDAFKKDGLLMELRNTLTIVDNAIEILEGKAENPEEAHRMGLFLATRKV